MYFIKPTTLIVLLVLAAPAFAQDEDAAADSMPVGADVESVAVDSDVLSDGDRLLLMSRLYQTVATLIEDEALGDSMDASVMVERLVDDLALLMTAENIGHDDRFRELYRTIATEVEQYYGSRDTLTFAYGDIFAVRDSMFASLASVADPLLEDVTDLDLGFTTTAVPMTMNRLVQSSIDYLKSSPDRHVNLWLERAHTYFPMIERIFAEEGVPDELKYLALVESGLNPRARSWARAVGMWQFISATGKSYGLNVNGWVDERMDPEKSTRAAARHLKDLNEMFGDWHLAMAGYNYNPYKLRKKVEAAEQRLGRKATYWDVYWEIPRETRNYIPLYIAAAMMVSQPEAFGLKAVDPGPSYSYHAVPVYGVHTLSKIAGMAGTSASTVRALNPELKRNALPPSASTYVVRIPVGSYDRFVEAYQQLPGEARQPATEYTIKRGDTLGEIAQSYGTSTTRLMSLNGLNSTRIRPGQRLAVPLPKYTSIESDEGELRASVTHYGQWAPRRITTTDTAAPPDLTPAQTSGRSTTRRSVRYTVKRGDTLGEIGDQYGVTASELRRWNGLKNSRIIVGQRLTIYPRASSAGTKVTYLVRRGDTLGEIAKKHGVTVTNLKRWNGLRSNTIEINQRLTVYEGGKPSAISYRVKRGDTLGKIAQQYGVTVMELKTWNRLRSSRIMTGQKLTIFS